MKPDQDATLRRVATLCDHADELARVAAMSATHSPPQAEEMGRQASAKVQEAVSLLAELGYQPERSAPLRRVEKNPLAELVAIERARPEALALLDALERVKLLAVALDDKHGATDYEDDFDQLIASLELLLYGPGDTVTGARE